MPTQARSRSTAKAFVQHTRTQASAAVRLSDDDQADPCEARRVRKNRCRRDELARGIARAEHRPVRKEECPVVCRLIPVGLHREPDCFRESFRPDALDRELVNRRHLAPRSASACRAWADRCTIQSAVQSIIRERGTEGWPKSFAAAAVFVNHAVGASLPTICAFRPRRAASSCASQRIEMISGPLTLIGEVGTVQCARQRSAHAFASPCHMTFTWPMVTSTGNPSRTLSATSASTP